MKPWDYQIELVHGSERLTDLLVRLGWCKSKTQAKQLLSQNGIRINGQPATSETVVHVPPQGVLLSKSRRSFVNLQPAYGDPLWDTKDENGQYLVDNLVRKVESQS